MIRCTHPEHGTRYRRAAVSGSYEPVPDEEFIAILESVWGRYGWKFEIVPERAVKTKGKSASDPDSAERDAKTDA